MTHYKNILKPPPNVVVISFILFLALFFTSSAYGGRLVLGHVPMDTSIFTGDTSLKRLKSLPKFLHRSGVRSALMHVLRDDDQNEIVIIDAKYKKRILSSTTNNQEYIDILHNFYQAYADEEFEFLNEVSDENNCQILFLWESPDQDELKDKLVNPVSLELVIYDSTNNVINTGFIKFDKVKWRTNREEHRDKVTESVIKLIKTVKEVLKQGAGE